MIPKFYFTPVIYDSGVVSTTAFPTFYADELNGTYLGMSLYSSDNDYNSSHFIEILDHFEDHLGEVSSWNGGEGDWYAYFDKNGNITIADDDEDSPEEALLPSITLPISEYKALLLKYRKQAQEFRDKLPQMQKEEDRRRANASDDSKKGDA